MRTVYGDIWDLRKTRKIVIPVNLAGPMGRGLAYQAKMRYPGLEERWKKACMQQKVYPGRVKLAGPLILFPVKYHWRDKADLELIEGSLGSLTTFDFRIALPQIGCGFGELDWDAEVAPLVERYLDDKDNVALVIPTRAVYARYKEAFRPGARKDRAF